jgi:hypothetical protein
VKVHVLFFVTTERSVSCCGVERAAVVVGACASFGSPASKASVVHECFSASNSTGITSGVICRYPPTKVLVRPGVAGHCPGLFDSCVAPHSFSCSICSEAASESLANTPCAAQISSTTAPHLAAHVRKQLPEWADGYMGTCLTKAFGLSTPNVLWLHFVSPLPSFTLPFINYNPASCCFDCSHPPPGFGSPASQAIAAGQIRNPPSSSRVGHGCGPALPSPVVQSGV